MSTSKKNKKNSLSKFQFDWIQSWTQSYGVRLFVYSPIGLAFLVLVIGSVVGHNIYDSPPPTKYLDILGACVCIVASLTGLIQILIRDGQGFFWPVKGKAATFWGGVWMIVWWLVALAFAWDYFFGIP